VRLRRVIAALAMALAAALNATSAGAIDLTTEEFTELADAARTDAGARAELDRVTAVDGRPIDVAALLSGDPADVDARLTTLSDLRPVSRPVDPDAARNDAAAILAGSEYQDADRSPGIGQRIFEWFADLIPDAIGRALADPALWSLVAAVVLLTGLVLVIRARRRRRSPRRRPERPEAETSRDPDAIEARARRATTDGDYSTAVRLWFEAGAIRLADRGVVPAEVSSTSGAIRRAVASPTMNDLARTFDRVAYGRRTADCVDAEAAESGWTDVLEGMPARG
jgi:hypothetical protein